MLLDSDKELYAAEVRAPTNGIPASTFSFGDAIGSLWKNVVLPGAQVYGQIEVAKASAAAQAKLDALKRQNASLGSNDPAAAQAEANKTLLQKWLPSGSSSSGSVMMLAVGAVLLLVLVLVLKRALK